MKMLRFLAIICAMSVTLFAFHKNPLKQETSSPSGESMPEVMRISDMSTDGNLSAVLASSVIGSAQLRHARDGSEEPLSAGQMLSEYDIITTRENTTVLITLEEGKEIHIGENTIFALSAIRRGADSNVNIFALKQGSIVNAVDTRLADNDVYEVHTPRLVMSIYGTSNYMSSDKNSDIVIGITGETHVFSGGQSFNVVQGTAVSYEDGKPPVIKPAASSDLPGLAASYADTRGLSFYGLSNSEINRAQRTAGNYSPSSRDFGAANGFTQSLFEDSNIIISGPDNQNPDNIQASIGMDESAFVMPPQSPAPTRLPIATPVPDLTRTTGQVVSDTQSSRSAASSEGSNASSSSSEKSDLQSLIDAVKDSVSRPGRNGSSKKSGSKSSNNPVSSSSSISSSDPSPGVLRITYVDSRDPQNIVGTQDIDITSGDGYITSNRLTLPYGYFISFYGHDDYVLFGSYASISASSSQISYGQDHRAIVYVYPFSAAGSSIRVQFYSGTAYMGGIGCAISASSLADGSADTAIRSLISGIWTDGSYIAEKSFTYEMIYAPDAAPYGVPNKISEPCVWVGVVPCNPATQATT